MKFWRGWPRTCCRLTPLVSIQNPGPEKCQEVRERVLANFSGLKKNWVPDMGGNSEKKTESKNSWTQFFFTPFLPYVWDSVFFRTLKLASPLSLASWNFLGSGFGYSLRVSSGILYGVSPDQIPTKCLDGATYTGLRRSLQIRFQHKFIFQKKQRLFARLFLLILVNLNKNKNKTNLFCNYIDRPFDSRSCSLENQQNNLKCLQKTSSAHI